MHFSLQKDAMNWCLAVDDQHTSALADVEALTFVILLQTRKDCAKTIFVEPFIFSVLFLLHWCILLLFFPSQKILCYMELRTIPRCLCI